MTQHDLLARLEEIERLLGLLLNRNQLQPTLEFGDIEAYRARSALQAELFSRKEAARYTRRSVKSFDATLRSRLNNFGSERRPLYSKKEIDECLHLTPGSSERTSAARTTTSAFRTTGSVTTNQRARRILQKLRGSPGDSTEK